MDEQVPAVLGQRADKRGADPLRAAGHDRGPRSFDSLAMAGAIGSRRRMRQGLPPASRLPSAAHADARTARRPCRPVLGDIARLAAEKKLPPVDEWNPEPLRRQRDADRPRRHLVPSRAARSAARRWFASSRPSCGASPTAASSWSRRSRSSTSRSRTRRSSRSSSRAKAKARPLARLPAQHRRPRRRRSRSSAPLRGRPDGPHPYLEVRDGLDALVARPVYYELANLALAEGGDPPGLWSGGAFFAMEAA